MDPFDARRLAALNDPALERIRASQSRVAQRIQDVQSRLNSNVIGEINIPPSAAGPTPVIQPAPPDVPEAPLDNVFGPPTQAPAPTPTQPAPAPVPTAPAPAPTTGPTELGPNSTVTNQFSSNIQQGSLLIADDFAVRPGGETHGQVVTSAAMGTGFDGPVERLNVLALDGVKANQERQTQTANELSQPNLSRQESLDIIGRATEASVGVVLESGIGALDSAIQGGAQNSALNISMSSSPADVTNFYLTNIIAGSQAAEGSDAQIASENFANAFGVDLADISSNDPAVASQSRALLAERSGQFVEDVFAESPYIRSRKQVFDQRAAEFEAGNNSLVVIAGNSGGFVDDVESVKGAPLNVSGDFETSILATPIATVVGATERVAGRSRVASFSSDTPETDLFANGTFDPNPRVSGDESTGTSFAAPAVAATLARLHLENPNSSSSEIESALLANETHLVNGDNGLVSNLNEGQINAPNQPPANRFSLFFGRNQVQDIRSRFLDVFGT